MLTGAAVVQDPKARHHFPRWMQHRYPGVCSNGRGYKPLKHLAPLLNTKSLPEGTFPTVHGSSRGAVVCCAVICA